MRALNIGEFVAVSDHDAIKALMTTQRDATVAGPANAIVTPRQLGKASLLTLEGPEHLRMRRLLLAPFHGDSVRAYAGLVEAVAAAEVARWPRGKPFALHPRLQAIALEVMLRAVVGVSDAQRHAGMRTLIPRVLQVNPFLIVADNAYPRVGDGPFGRVIPWMRRRRRLDALIEAEIASHRAAPDGRDDILAMLIASRDENGRALSDGELRDQVITLLLAGNETTATAMAWSFERILRRPAVLARLLAEIEAGEQEDYLDAVVSETLRLRPPVDAVWRRTTEPIEVGGYRVEAGMLVAPAVRGVARDESLWPDPEEFEPERWLGESAAPRYGSIPFGGGIRRCVGASFAAMEMKTVLRVVLSTVELHAPSERDERQDRLRSFTTVPARGARVIARAS